MFDGVETTLTLELAKLKRAAPDRFEAVEKALTAYAAAKLRDCMLAGNDEAYRAQGRAQNADTLTKLFINCLQDADEVHRKMAQRQAQQLRPPQSQFKP